MTDCTNPSCAPYPAGEGAFVCKNCLQVLRRDLGDIPALIDDLHTTLTRQDVLGASSGRRASETSLPWKETASEALWVLINTVMSAVREFHDAGVPFPDAPIAGARWLLANTGRVAASREGGRVVDEIGAAVARAYEVIDRPPDLLLAGQCGHELDGGGVCEEYLYAHPDATRIKCRACGHQHAVEERRAWMVNAAAEMQLPAVTCLAWVKVLMGKAIPRGTFDSWVHKHGTLAPVARDHVGNPLYRFGDVRDRAADWVARPRKNDSKDKVA
jgi:hypothetical protein